MWILGLKGLTGHFRQSRQGVKGSFGSKFI